MVRNGLCVFVSKILALKTQSSRVARQRWTRTTLVNANPHLTVEQIQAIVGVLHGSILAHFIWSKTRHGLFDWSNICTLRPRAYTRTQNLDDKKSLYRDIDNKLHIYFLLSLPPSLPPSLLPPFSLSFSLSVSFFLSVIFTSVLIKTRKSVSKKSITKRPIFAPLRMSKIDIISYSFWDEESNDVNYNYHVENI